MAKMETSPTPYGSDTKLTISKKDPDLKDYDLRGIEIEEAENGCKVVLRYEMKEPLKAKARKKGEYPDSYQRKEYVFESMSAAKKFLMAEVDKLAPGSDDEGDED